MQREREPLPQPTVEGSNHLGCETSITRPQDLQIAAVYEEHSAALKRYLWSKVRSRDDVADLMHETYERFQRYTDRIELASARNFLFTIARNLVIDRARHRRVSQVDQDVDVELLLDPLPSPEQQTINEEAIEALNQAIETLPMQCRRVFVMRKIHQLSQKDIAEKLGISVSTVEKHVATGMKQCRQLLIKPNWS